jgi:hypothetical protein
LEGGPRQEYVILNEINFPVMFLLLILTSNTAIACPTLMLKSTNSFLILCGAQSTQLPACLRLPLCIHALPA